MTLTLNFTVTSSGKKKKKKKNSSIKSAVNPAHESTGEFANQQEAL